VIFDAIMRARDECLRAHHEPDVLMLDGPAYDALRADHRFASALAARNLALPMRFMGMTIEVRRDVSPRIVSAHLARAFELDLGQVAGAEK
jgi:hypothetical protein